MTAQIPRWQTELRDAIRDPAELRSVLGLPPAPTAARTGFALRVPRPFVARMRRGDANDPLLRQVWPHVDEDRPADGFQDDAVSELGRLKPGGLIHKYHGRALVLASGACAVHCRYCFRREFPYGESMARGGWQRTLDALAADTSIREVILSGGDPLSLSDDKLAALVTSLDDIRHIQRLRIHTRQPVVLPSRIDAPLLAWIRATRLRTVMVIHVNHANEIDEELARGLQQLREQGVQLLNQAVLLRGVNDNPDALVHLSENLFDVGVLPYYLHLLDRVTGSAHFEVPADRARALMRAAQERLPGYLLPRLAQEEPGKPAKTLITW